ncbi:Alkaline phosphatase synthesis transcriptional regulatory protein SphR [bioreactor metagenome]|uniref:Alkaline phosphatase synthesis transcriptional regulatory protein SphR n=1 Tax=bioreactor metagenome TaxID=1076179 RepID=A0A645HGQ1_9ZZZZ
MLTGYRCGCDDYIAKPFSVNVLKQKITVLLKRTQNDKAIFKYEGLTVDYDKMLVTINDTECKLTPTEYKLLSYMTTNQGKVLTRSILLEQIWDSDGNYVDENTLSVYIRRLRAKLEKNVAAPQYVRTVFGIGYTLGE